MDYNNKKKYGIIFVCALIIAGGGLGLASMNQTKQKATIENSRPILQDESIKGEKNSSEKKEKKKERLLKKSLTEDKAAQLLENYGENEPKSRLQPFGSSLSSNELNNVSLVMKEQAKETESKDTPPVVKPIIPEKPTGPLNPQPEPEWIVPGLSTSYQTILLRVGDRFNPYDYFSVQLGSDTNPIVSTSEIDTRAPGQYVLRIEVKDSKGKVSQLNISVIVSYPPILTVTLSEVHIQAGQQVNLQEYVSATDSTGQDITTNIVTEGVVDSETEGSYFVRYTVYDRNGFSASTTIEFIVTNEVPVIHVKDVTHEIDQPFNPLTGVTVTDREDGFINVTEVNVLENTVNISEEGVYSVTIGNVKDRHGKAAANVTYQITVTNEAPVIHAKDMVHEIGLPFDPLAGVTVTDREDGTINLTEANVLENTVNSDVEGTYTVTIGNVKDKHGKAASDVTYQVVVENEAPTITNIDLTLEEGTLFDSATYRSQLIVSDREDDKSEKPLTVILSEEDIPKVDTLVPGIYEIHITVRDSYGKETSVVGTITVTAKIEEPEAPQKNEEVNEDEMN